MVSNCEGVWAIGSTSSPIVITRTEHLQVKEFSPIKFPNKEYILQVSVADLHCLALDIMGRVFGWGRNQHRQISNGLPITEQVSTPTLIKDCNFESMGWIYANNTASFSISFGGKAYVWGCHLQTQSSRVHLNDSEECTKLSELKLEAPYQERRFKRIVGGDYRFGAVTMQNELFVFGLNSATNFLGLTSLQIAAYSSMAVEKPQKVELGNLIFEDIIFFADSSLLLCREPQPTPYDVPAAAAFRMQVFKISESRCQILNGLKEQKKRGIDMSKQIAAVRSPNKKHPSLEFFNQKDGSRKSIMGLRQGSMILSPSSTPAKPNLFFPSRDFPAVKTLEKIPSKVISSPPSMQASNIFNDDFSKAAMAIFQEAQAKTSSKVKQQLQKIVASVDAHDLVFGELHPRGTTNGVMVTAPSDLMRVPGKDLAKSYMGLITNGQEENVINYTLSGGAFYRRHRRSKSDRNPHAALDENSEESQPRKPINVEVNSRNLNICYSILDRVDNGIEKVKGYKGDMLEKVNVIKQGLKECRKQAEKRILIKIERKKAYEEAMNPETNALMPLGVTIAERIAKMAKESEEYEKRVQDVKASKEQQNNSKIERLKEIIHLMKPHMDLKEVQQLKQLTEHSKDVQKLLFIVKTAGFLRLVDALRKVYRIEKRFSMHDTKLRQLVLNVASRYTAPDHRYWFEGLVKKVRLDSTIKRITMQRLRKKVIQSSNTVIMKVKALKTFFSIAILKKYQSMLYLQLRYEAYMLKTFTHGTIPHQVIETHLIKAQFLLKECFQVNKDLIQKNRNLLAARLCLSTDHISNVMGAADHRIGIEDEASSVSYTAILEEAADGKKAGESKVAIRSSPEYTLSEEERSTKKGIKILKCCYLPYTKHCSLALPSQAIPVRPEQITEASSSKLLAKLANLFPRINGAEVEA